MQVQNIECHLAQVQLKRYLAGDEMPDELLADLVGHIKRCKECTQAAEQHKESLADMLNCHAARPAGDGLMAKIAAGGKALVTPRDPSGERSPLIQSPKTLILSGALALTLIVMSTVMRDPTALFGPRASEVQQDTPPTSEAEPKAEKADEPKKTEEPAEEKASEPAEPTAILPGETNPAVEEPIGEADDQVLVAETGKPTAAVPAKPVAKPAATAPKATTKAPARSTAKPTESAPKPGTGTIRVYAPDGKPVPVKG